MITTFEAKEMVNTYREILKKVIRDKQYLQKMVIEIEVRESEMRTKYHEALKEYDQITRPRRRFR